MVVLYQVLKQSECYLIFVIKGISVRTLQTSNHLKNYKSGTKFQHFIYAWYMYIIDHIPNVGFQTE
jgi:hypothetical protein